MHQDIRTSAIRRFFTGLTEYAFHARLGVADPPLVDYICGAAGALRAVATSCTPCAPCAASGWCKWPTCWPRRSIAKAPRGNKCTATSATSRCSGRACIRKWSTACAAAARTRSSIISSKASGRTGSRARSRWKKESRAADVLKRLSEQFELCVYGLGEVRRQWEQRGGNADAPLLLG